MDFKVEGDRTIVSFEERDIFNITKYDFSGLERDLQRKDLSSQLKHAIDKEIEKNALLFLKDIGRGFGMTEALDKDKNKRTDYFDHEEGINIHLDVGVGWKGGGKEDNYFSFPSQINMRVGEEGKSASLQWSFRGGVETIPFRYMLKIHSAITGRYKLSYDLEDPNFPTLIVNPVNEFPRFMEGVEQSCKLLRESGAQEELARLQNKLTNNPAIDSVINGMYAKKFLDIFFDIKVE
jgi:hypothetical protein